MRCAGNRKARVCKDVAYILTKNVIGGGGVAIYHKDSAALKYGTGSMILHSANHPVSRSLSNIHYQISHHTLHNPLLMRSKEPIYPELSNLPRNTDRHRGTT
uniref:Uncharacterized protein n=1 Tax=Candidatus Methanogaster sp. ANME-2c ERB4 TaxID=2759911 RepID=A0A7G9Y9Q1_9EURY|nr:hypothetical protein EIKFJJEF_00002 [Methanosarcinales archaeon ANME-2c ERB4]